MNKLINLTTLLKEGLYRVISTGSYDKLVATANYMGSWGLSCYGVIKQGYVIYSSNSQHQLPLSIIDFVKQYKGGN
ncbi:MAG: hypothetical protein QXI16_00455 [Sulfolobaceae archaeon]